MSVAVKSSSHRCAVCGRAAEWHFAELAADVCGFECQRRLWTALDPARRREIAAEAPPFPFSEDAWQHRRHTISHALVRGAATHVRVQTDGATTQRIGSVVALDGTYLQRPERKDEDRFFVRNSDKRKIEGQQGRETERIKPRAFERLYAIGVYDGHGGDAVSRELSDNDLKVLFNDDDEESTRIVDDAAIAAQFERWDRAVLASDPKSVNGTSGFVGSTGTLLLVTKRELRVAYVGDSLALLYVRSPRQVFIVPEHDPWLLVERQRIKAKGARINVQTGPGTKGSNIVAGDEIDTTRERVISVDARRQKLFDKWSARTRARLVAEDVFAPESALRLQAPTAAFFSAGLAMTRAFGDFVLKRDFTAADGASLTTTVDNYDPRGALSVEPSLLSVDLDGVYGDVFVVVASDGMWDFFVDPATQVPALIEALLADAETSQRNDSISEAIAEELFAVVETGWDSERARAKAMVTREKHDDTTILVTHLANSSAFE